LLILAWAGTGCGSDPNRTGLSMQVSLGGLVIDQLEFTVTASTPINVDHVRRPEVPSGPLADHQVIEIYLRDDLAGRGVTCDVVGMSANNPKASDRENAKVIAGQLVPVAITLGGAAKDGGADDARPDADAARDVAVDIDANADVPPVDSGDNEAGVKPLGTPCATADECDSGVCVDGVCCTSTCSVCHACNVAGKEGTCQPSPAGTKAAPCVDQKIPCGYNGTCDGQGACFRPMAGQMCSPAACQGSNLLPPSACDGQGMCQPAIPVACAPFNCDGANGPHCRSSCTVPADCVTTAACANNSCGPKPRKVNGAGCVAASECMSNVCVDGVCCNTNCTGACMACNLTGQAGTCRPVPSGKADPHNVCKDMGAASCGSNGQCDGSGGCLRYPVGSICESPQCLAHAIIGAKKCAAGGVCMATAPTDCAPFKCNPADTMCFTSCMTNAECAAATGKSCKNGTCR
jgi:hypothetical protein